MNSLGSKSKSLAAVVACNSEIYVPAKLNMKCPSLSALKGIKHNLLKKMRYLMPKETLIVLVTYLTGLTQ